MLTVVLFGPLCLLQAYYIYSRKSYRHIVQIVICVAELYGGWMTFCPEWIQGSPNLNGSDPVLFWVSVTVWVLTTASVAGFDTIIVSLFQIYLVFMNGLWVFVPLVLLWDSWAQLNSACVKAKMSLSPRDLAEWAPARIWYYAIAALLALYCVLVPAVLGSAEGVPVAKALPTKGYSFWDNIQNIQNFQVPKFG